MTDTPTPNPGAWHGDLTRRVLGWMLVLSLVPLLIMASQGYHCGKQAIIEKTHDHLLSIMNSRSALVSTWYDQRFSELDVVASSPSVARCCSHFLDLSEEEIDREVTAMLRSVVTRVNAYDEIAVLSHEGKVIADVSGDGKSTLDNAPPEFLARVKSGDRFQLSAPTFHSDGSVLMRIGRRIEQGGTHAGIILAVLNLTRGLDPLLQSRAGMGETGKVYLVWLHDPLVLGSSNFIPGLPAQIMTEPFAGGSRVALRTRPSDEAIAAIHNEESGILAYNDYRNKEVWAAATTMPPVGLPASTREDDMQSRGFEERDQNESVIFNGGGLLGVESIVSGMALVVEQDTSEALAWLHTLIWRVGATGVITVIVLVIVALWISRRLGEPLRVLAQVAQRVRGGATEERVGPLHGTEADEVRKAFNQMLDELAAKQRELLRTATLASIGELSSSIVHEMRNPLSSIKMNLQALKRDINGDTASHELAAIADEQSRRLEHMLDDLLQYGRPIQMSPQPIPFQDLMQSVLPVVNEQARANRISIETHDESLHAAYLVDPEQMCRALTNLLVNAVQASPPGGTVTVRARKESLWGEAGYIDVIDSGPGFSEEGEKRIFSPFFTTKQGGTGLGLANVKKIVELHGGNVTAANRAEGGAMFSMRLPLVQGATV